MQHNNDWVGLGVKCPSIHAGDGPAFLVQHTTNIEFTDLQIAGHNTGVIVTDSALVRCARLASSVRPSVRPSVQPI
jgi:hypothetical protein